MNIVFLIGNGFDIKQGLKTSYYNFREYYKSLENGDSDILAFISRIEKEELNDDKWSDLELALGLHTDIFIGKNAVDNAIAFHDKLSSAIYSYLNDQEANLNITQKTLSQFYLHLKQPEAIGLLPTEKVQMSKFRTLWKNYNQWHTNVITFNYTNTIQKCSNFSTKPINIGRLMNSDVYLKEIEHIHGYHGHRQIVGLNDESQIVNSVLHGSEAQNWYIKSNNNRANGEGCQEKCLNWIKNGDLICVFGLSYGSTDELWWASIIKRLLNEPNTRLILFAHDSVNKYNSNQHPHINRFKENEKKKFVKASGIDLPTNKIENLMSRIFVGYNTNLFKFSE